MQIALGLLSFLRPKLLAADFSECLSLLKQLPADLPSDAIFTGISSVEIPKKLYVDLVGREKKGRSAPQTPLSKLGGS